MQRRFGPTRGAGTVVIEQEGGKSILPAALGTVCYVGVLERGRPGSLIETVGSRDFGRKCGTYRPDSEVADSAFDFFNVGNGAGQMFAVRVTDGTEIKSFDRVTSRHSGMGEYPDRAVQNNSKRPLLTVRAKNGGRWGGRQRVLSFSAASVADLEVDTGIAMLVDEFKDARLRLLGVPDREYIVIGNDAAGVLTLEAGSTAAADLAANQPGISEAVLYLDNATRSFNAVGSTAGDRVGLYLLWKEAEDKSHPSNFGLDVFIDSVRVKSYPNLSLDPESKYAFGSMVNEDPSNHWVEFDVLHAGPYTAANRPANWSGEYKTYSAGVITTDIAHTKLIPLDDTKNLGRVKDFTYGTKVARCRLTLTFSDANNFTVETDAAYGAVFDNLPDGIVGTAYATTLSGADMPLTSFPFMIGFTVEAGHDDFSDGDKFVIDVDPLPVDLQTGAGLLEGWVYPNDSAMDRFGIESNTVNTITLKNSPAVAPNVGGQAQTGGPIWQSTANVSFPTVGGDVLIHTDNTGAVTLTYGITANMAALLVALNAAAAGVGLPNDLFTNAAAMVRLRTANYDGSDTRRGGESFIKLIDAPAELHFNTGVVVSGACGVTWRVEAPRDCIDGYDGDTPDDADYTAIFNSVTSPLNALYGKNSGLVKVACPGITATAVQRAGIAYCEARSYQFRYEIPSNITDEVSAIGYVNDTLGRNDFAVAAWPHYGWMPNPIGRGLVLRSGTGQIHGREAAIARAFDGYHKAAAGEDATLPGFVKTELPDDYVINEEVLNPSGIQTIKKLKGRYVIWGDRTLYVDPAWLWKHQRELMSHYERTLLEAFDWIIFMINDPTTQALAYGALRSFFQPEHTKRAIRGATVDDAAAIKIDSENNTDDTRSTGDLNAEIGLRLADTVERFNISIGKRGVVANAG